MKQEARSDRNYLSLCTTYDAHDPELLVGVMPYVDCIEVTPDTIANSRNGKTWLHPKIIADLQKVAGSVDILAHGVGLSIGSFEGWSASYLRLLEELRQAVPLRWHSEHLGYVQVDGENLNTMLSMPRTQAVADMLIDRIKALQCRYDLPFLLENIARFLPDYPPRYSEAGFLNYLTQHTGCGLILDLYNLECDAYNFGFNIPRFLKALDLDSVIEMHLAGGTVHNSFQLDIHSNIVADSTLELAAAVIPKLKNLQVITYEILPQAVQTHGRQMVIEEVARLSEYFKTHKNAARTIATSP